MRPWLRIILFLSLGLISGVGLGLYVGWIAWPTQYTEADLTILADDYRYDFAVMIATTYGQDGDLVAARQRLERLGETNPEAWLLDTTVRAILSGAREADIRNLAQLTHDLGQSSPALEPYLPAEADG